MPVVDVLDLSCFARLSLPLLSIISQTAGALHYYNLFIQFYSLLWSLTTWPECSDRYSHAFTPELLCNLLF